MRYEKITEGSEEKETLFIFSFTAGGVSTFREWGKQFKGISVNAFQYPESENRFLVHAMRK